MNVIIFSKDRAMQLDLLLQSIVKLAPRHALAGPKIIYKASDPSFAEGYERLKKVWQPWNDTQIFYPETRIKDDILSHIEPSNMYTTFLVDDDVFYRPVLSFPVLEPKKAYAPRLGLNCRYCYNARRPQAEGELDFLCKFSVDGHVYLTSDLMYWLQSMTIYHINQMEAQLWDKFGDFELIYPEHSALVGIPHNRVQDLFPNRCGDVTAAALNNLFLEGYRVDFEAMDFSDVFGVHQEIPYVYKKI